MDSGIAHALLGTRPGDDGEAIKAAYRKRCLETHPDRPGGDPERFRLITSAYEVLRSDGGDVQSDTPGVDVDLPTWLREPLETIVDRKSRSTLNRLIGKDRASGIVAVASALLGAPDVVRSMKTRKKRNK